MSKALLLDCTLRDGAYIVDANFGENAIRGIINKLTDSKVDIIECGWLKDADYTKGSTFYHVPEDLQGYLNGVKRPSSIYTVMIDWNRYDLSQLPPCDGKSIDAIRVVFPREHYKEGIGLASAITEKGYKVFFQAANTLGYSDKELLDMIDTVNSSDAASLSIVDTFGAMYPEDLARIISLVDHNLEKNICLGFHSHNNLQLSFALCMEFVKTVRNTQRTIILDSSLCGMGRGAGNAPTELVADFLNKTCGTTFDMNKILDSIDLYMNYFLKNYSWGYSVPYYISGILCAHVNNIAYLTKTHRTGAHDMKVILESIDGETRTKYDYDNLEKAYIEYQNEKIDDSSVIEKLANKFNGRELLLVCPGKSLSAYRKKIQVFINTEQPIVIGINSAYKGFQYDYLFFSNAVRYEYAMEVNEEVKNIPLIATSNIKCQLPATADILNYTDYAKQGWKHFDNSAVIFLRFLQRLELKGITIAGFDGYAERGEKYYEDPLLQTTADASEFRAMNVEIGEMLQEITGNGENKIVFLTPSEFEKVLPG